MTPQVHHPPADLGGSGGVTWTLNPADAGTALDAGLPGGWAFWLRALALVPSTGSWGMAHPLQNPTGGTGTLGSDTPGTAWGDPSGGTGLALSASAMGATGERWLPRAGLAQAMRGVDPSDLRAAAMRAAMHMRFTERLAAIVAGAEHVRLDAATEPPNDAARAQAEALFGRLADAGLHPVSVQASAIGGYSLRLCGGPGYAIVECDNDGDVTVMCKTPSRGLQNWLIGDDGVPLARSVADLGRIVRELGG